MDQPKVGAYCRISQDRAGAGLGIDRQREDCYALVTAHGWTVARDYTDNDLSAYTGKPRPGYEALLADIEAGIITAVVAWHADRLHRSTVELERYISICEPRGVPTYTVRAGELDLTTAAGRMMARVTGAVARHESEQKSERIRRAREQAVTAGKWTGGSRPYGFDADGVTHRPGEVSVLRECASRILAGEPVYAVARGLAERGITSPQGALWSSVNLRRVLLKPRNAGLVSHRGEVVGRAEWEPVIDPEVWRAMCAMLRGGRKPWSVGMRSKVLVGSGLYRCECGRTIFSGGSTSAGKPRYRCAGLHLYRTAGPVDAYVHRIVERVLAELGSALLPPEQDTTPLRERVAALEERRRELARDYGSLGLSAEQVRTANAELDRLLEAARGELDVRTAGSALAGIVDAADPVGEYRAATMDRQRAVIDALFEVTLLRGTRGAKFDESTVRLEPRSRPGE